MDEASIGGAPVARPGGVAGAVLQAASSVSPSPAKRKRRKRPPAMAAASPFPVPAASSDPTIPTCSPGRGCRPDALAGLRLVRQRQDGRARHRRRHVAFGNRLRLDVARDLPAALDLDLTVA